MEKRFTSQSDAHEDSDSGKEAELPDFCDMSYTELLRYGELMHERLSDESLGSLVDEIEKRRQAGGEES